MTNMAATTDAATATGGVFGTVSFLLPIILMFGLLYFLMIRPQKKKEKEVTDMRSSVEVGDEITTIGGIVGRVVNIKDEFITIETGADKTKIKFMRWAIQSKEAKIEG